MTADATIKNELIDWLCVDFSEQTSEIQREKLEDLVELLHNNAHELKIFDKNNIYRFIGLNFLPKPLLNSPLIQSVIIRVLNNLDLSETKRLDFIYHNVVNRNLE